MAQWINKVVKETL